MNGRPVETSSTIYETRSQKKSHVTLGMVYTQQNFQLTLLFPTFNSRTLSHHSLFRPGLESVLTIINDSDPRKTLHFDPSANV